MTGIQEPPTPTEDSPLLIKASADDNATPPSMQEGQQPPAAATAVQDLDPGWNRHAIRIAALAALFLVLSAFADLLKYVSTIRLIELGVCREHYLEHDPSVIDGDNNIPERLCKLSEVQQRLAHLRGYMSALEAVVGLLLTIPYGLLVGRLGEPLLAGINMVGYLLSDAWLLLVCYYWSIFPAWTAVLSPLCRVVGGGSPFLSSLIYSIAAKHVPETKRSLCFFVFLAAQTITSTVAVWVTSSFLDHGFLFFPLMLNFPIGILCLVTLIAIRLTAPSEPAATSDTASCNENDPDAGKPVSIRDSIHNLSEALRERNVLVLLLTVPVAKAVNPIGELTWQYIPKRFGISLATAGRALTIPSIECLILLLVVLPGIKSFAQQKYAITSATVDLYFVQYGFLIQAVGCLIMAMSSTLVVFISGILVFALGCSTRPALQAVLAGLVNRKHVAVLFTVVAVADCIGSAAGAFIFNWAFALALGWFKEWYLGFPFVIAASCFVAAFTASVYVAYNSS